MLRAADLEAVPALPVAPGRRVKKLLQLRPARGRVTEGSDHRGLIAQPGLGLLGARLRPGEAQLRANLLNAPLHRCPVPEDDCQSHQAELDVHLLPHRDSLQAERSASESGVEEALLKTGSCTARGRRPRLLLRCRESLHGARLRDRGRRSAPGSLLVGRKPSWKHYSHFPTHPVPDAHEVLRLRQERLAHFALPEVGLRIRQPAPGARCQG